VSIQLYMDEHVPAPITEGLRLRGVDVLTVQEDGFEAKDDDVIVERASSLNRVVFTMDDDFFREASKLLREGRHFAGVIYAHQLSVTIGQCVRDLELIGHAGQPEDFADRIEVVPL
jgi:predicted nuclease of predicted toxin-antitoxin system